MTPAETPPDALPDHVRRNHEAWDEWARQWPTEEVWVARKRG
jgi:hypothetical protein